MLATIEKRSLLKVLLSSFCGALLTMATLTLDVAAETVTITLHPGTEINPGTTTPAITATGCLFSAQLASDAAMRASFTERVALLKQPSGTVADDDDSDIYHTTIDANISLTRVSSGIDGLSNDCLSCHDGVMAKSFDVRIKNNPAGRVMSLIDIIGGHPVGMEYDKYVSMDGKEFRREVSFSREMVFAEGKVGCLTCHNPLNSAKGHLVMQNSRSELCFACHNK